MKYHYIVVEGPHDAAAVGKILELLDARWIKKLRTLQKLDEKEYFMKLTNIDFPYKDDLTERMPVPLFYLFENSGQESELVAVHSAGGESAMMATMNVTLGGLNDNGRGFSSLSILGDADDRPPAEVLVYHLSKLRELESPPMVMRHFENIIKAGQVLETVYGQRIGLYVLPDNENRGTLENVLLECANNSYNQFQTKAVEYVDFFATSPLLEWSGSKRNKAIVGCINNLLRPGTSNTVSIAKDSWLCLESIHLTSASKLQTFLKQLLALEPIVTEED